MKTLKFFQITLLAAALLIEACSGDVSSSLSPTTSSTSTALPATPAGLTASAGNAQIILGLTTVSGATSYNIYRSTTSGVKGSSIASQAAANYTDTAVSNGTTYYYQVTANNTAGESAASTQKSATPLTIGTTYGGGVVAYILQSGDSGYDANVLHGIIAAAADQSTGIVWVSGGSTQTTALPAGSSTETTLGTGSVNTTNIIAQAVAAGNTTPSTYAAGLARATSDGGYSDWYLPSQDELDKLYQNKTSIGGFASSSYWSSSQSTSAPASSAYYQSLSSGTKDQFTKSAAFVRVRAVRSF